MTRCLSVALLPLLCAPLIAQSLPEVEPNDNAATASLIFPGVQAYGDIGPLSTDVDYYTFTLAAASDVRAMTSPGFGFLNQVDDTMLTLIASDGVTVIAFDDDFSGRGYYSQVTGGNLAAGTYYLKVESYFGSYVGNYCLDLIVAPNCDLVSQTAIQPEGAEPNDPRVSGGAATMTTYDSRNFGNISASAGGTSYTDATSDYDFWGFTVAAAGAITLATCPTSSAPAPTISDTVIFLTDANYNVLATNDDSCGLLSQLTYNIAVPGQYFAVVKGYTGYSGNYYLDIGTPSPLCTAASITNATFVANPGGCVGSNGTPHLDVRETISYSGVFPERPLIGSEFVMDVTNVPPATLLIEVLGFVTLPLPGFDLGPLGAPGCFVETSPLINTIAFSSGTGDAFWSLPIPYNLGICGLPLELQVAVFDAPANLLGITVSNRGSVVVGNGY